MQSPKEILQKYWGFDSFRNKQEDVIRAILRGDNTVVLLPTGGGKSVCFQVPTLLKDGVCIVISPLIALMQDQVKSLQDKGIKAMTIPSGSSQDDIIALFDNLRFGNYKFLYLSPERLQSRFIQEKIQQLQVSLIAIDEAHCISEWGHDFRPSYRNVSVLTEIHPKAILVALTATATTKVLDDIVASLGLEAPKIFKESFFRENLAYQVFKTDDKLYKLKQIFTKIKSPAIVYVNTRKRTKDISNYLSANGFKSGFYHGGLSSVEKQIVLDDWMREKTPIMVATNAFGMGIDKPNVRVVVHLNLPNSIENYMQEAGRAGRDGKKAFSVILTNKSDVELTQELQKNTLPSVKKVKKVHKKLYQHFQIAKGELVVTKFDFNLLEFSNKYNFKPNKTFTALQILHNNGVVEIQNNYQKKSTIQFLVNSHQILHYADTNQKRKNFIQSLLRMYGGLFEQDVKIDEFYLAKKVGITSWSVISQLEKLAEDNIIAYNKASTNSDLYFLHPREDNKTINRISKNIEAYLEQKTKKTQKLIEFIQEQEICRSILLLNYFGETAIQKCGMCDVCLQQRRVIRDISEQILHLFKTNSELSSREICAQIKAKEEEVLINLRELLSEEKIELNAYNKYFLSNR